MSDDITLQEYLDAVKPKNKFFARRTEVDGIWFDSKKEAARYRELKILERTGAVTGLKLQPEFKLSVNGFFICTYRADFSYIDIEKGQAIVEDCKGMKTPVYKLKKALFRAIYGREILET